jgi:hypothetical protein
LSPSEAERWDLSRLFSKKPGDLDAQSAPEGLQFVVKDAPVIIFYFGDSGPIKLKAMSSQSP